MPYRYIVSYTTGPPGNRDREDDEGLWVITEKEAQTLGKQFIENTKSHYSDAIRFVMKIEKKKILKFKN